MLNFARGVIRAANWLNWLLGAIVAAMFAAMLVVPDAIRAQLDGMSGEAADADYAWLVVAIGLVLPVVLLVHAIFVRVIALIDTAQAADSFSDDNARRLTTIAWCLLAINVVDLAYGVISAMTSDRAEPYLGGWFPALTGWFAVLLLFVLARVFQQGASMRADLEGTV